MLLISPAATKSDFVVLGGWVCGAPLGTLGLVSVEVIWHILRWCGAAASSKLAQGARQRGIPAPTPRATENAKATTKNERSEGSVSSEWGRHHTKPNVVEPVAGLVPEAEGATRVVGEVDPGAAPQHTGEIERGIQILAAIFRPVRVVETRTHNMPAPQAPRPLPYVAAHVCRPANRVTTGEETRRAGVAKAGFVHVAALLNALLFVPPRKGPPISMACGAFPFCFARQSHRQLHLLGPPAAEGEGFKPTDAHARMARHLKHGIAVLWPADLRRPLPLPARLSPESFVTVAARVHKGLILHDRHRVAANGERLCDHRAIVLFRSLAHLERPWPNLDPANVGNAVLEADAGTFITKATQDDAGLG